eukprot:759884-Hanusia_phi.AAC.4
MFDFSPLLPLPAHALAASSHFFILHFIDCLDQHQALRGQPPGRAHAIELLCMQLLGRLSASCARVQARRGEAGAGGEKEVLVATGTEACSSRPRCHRPG